MSAHSVSPAAEGTTWAESTEALAASGMYELSVCQPSLPRRDLYRCWPGPMIVPSGFWLLMGTAFCSGSAARSSISPNRFAKATCSASVRFWPGKTRTAYSWNAASTVCHVAGSSRPSSRSVTTAPRVAAIGAMRGAMEPSWSGRMRPTWGGVKRDGLHQNGGQREVLWAAADVGGDHVHRPVALLGGADLDDLHVVRGVERQGTAGGGGLVAHVTLAGRIGHDQVQVVDQRRPGEVRVAERDPQRVARGGHLDREGRLIAGLEPGPVHRSEHALDRAVEVDPPEALVVVDDRGGRRGAGQALRPRDEQGLEEGGRRARDALLLPEELAEQGHRPRGERGRHAGAAHVKVVGLVRRIGRPGEVVRGHLRGAGGEDEGTRREHVRLHAVVGRRPAAAEGHHLIGVIGHWIALDRVRGEIRGPPLPVRLRIELGAEVLAGPHRDAVLRGARRGHALQIDLAVSVVVGAVVARRDDEAEILVVPHELVELAALIVVRPRVAAAPRVGMDPRAVGVGELEELAEVRGEAGEDVA